MNDAAISCQMRTRALGTYRVILHSVACLVVLQATASFSPPAVRAGSLDDERPIRLKGAVVFVPPLKHLRQQSSRLGEGTPAVLELRAKVEADPLNHELRYRYGAMLASVERYSESLKELEIALTLKPDLVGAMIALGEVYFNLGRYEDSERVLVEALAIDEDDGAVLNALSLYYYYSPHLEGTYREKSEQYMSKAMQQDKGNIVYRRNNAFMREEDCVARRNESCVKAKEAWAKVIDLARQEGDKECVAEAQEHLARLKLLLSEDQ